MKGLIKRARVWVPVAKAAALFLLPLPLVLAVLAALIGGDVGMLAYTGAALGCFWGAGVLSWRALVAEARYFLGERPDPPAVPLKLVSAVITAVGASLAATAGGHGVPGSLVFAALGGLGYVAFYGADLRPRRIEVAVVDGVDRSAVTLQLKQAYGRLRGIETAARAIAVREFTERLLRITAIGRTILVEIEQDPREAVRARRFLNIYLDSAQHVTREYARTHRQLRNRSLEQSFRQLLVDMENTFANQHRKLLEHDMLSLDVEIEVLNARLKRELPEREPVAARQLHSGDLS
ncbi:MAG: 5-bromo-4-chloroindolyl phosphate hydrolase [Luteitalea sp.]|nr:5-bromo-4-chloroindolyl phosphate hydrolase [Luteitalea sp.]